jgi:multiple sugar transport system permease protein
MIRRLGLVGAGALLVLLNGLPLALIVKQALTPEAESLAWPPTWWPQTLTGENLAEVTRGAELQRALWMSGIVAVATAALTLAIGSGAAWVAARFGRAARAFDAATVAVRLFPTIAVAVPLGALFVRGGLYNHSWGIGLTLAHTLLGLPYAFLIVRNGVRAVPLDLEEAARLDGCPTAGVLWHVVLPLCRPALAAAAVLVLIVSWDEFAYALLLQVTNRPLPPLLYYFAVFGHPGLASAVAAIMLVPALAIVAVLQPAIRSGALAGAGR